MHLPNINAPDTTPILNPAHPDHTIASHLAFPLPIGNLTLLIGNPGAGKSLLALDLAHRAVNGYPLPPLHPNTPFPQEKDIHPEILPSTKPGEVVWFSAEDPNRSFIHDSLYNGLFITPPNSLATLIPERYTPLHKRESFPEDSPLLHYLKNRPFENLRLLILDPLPAFTGPINAASTTLRNYLLPLLNLASKARFAILGISHTTKSKRPLANLHDDPLHLALGTVGFTALTSSVLYLTRDFHNHNYERRILVPLKYNFAPIHAAYAFSLQSRPNDPEQPTRRIPPELIWETNPILEHPLLRNAQNYHEPTDPDILLRQSQMDLACTFLQESLKDAPQPSASILKTARTLGISPITLNRARFKLNIQTTRQKDHWQMSLPTPEPTAPEPQQLPTAT